MKTELKSIEMLALELTAENIVKKSKLKSINHRIVEVLKDGRKLKRINLITEITLLRLKDQGLKIDSKSFEDDDFKTNYFKVNRTVKNGVDTSIAKGHTNANFSFNPEFKSWSLQKTVDQEYFLIEK